MKISIENKELVSIHNFVFGLIIKGKKSRGRSKFLKLIMRKIDELNEDRKEILERYADKDDEGKPIKQSDGNYKFEDSDENTRLANAELAELNKEVAVIEYGEYVNNINELEEFLIDYDGEMSGQDAQAFDTLLDAFENKEEK